MSKLSCLTWNTAKRLKHIESQVETIRALNPDIVALQEVISSSEIKFKELLSPYFSNIYSSFELVDDRDILSGKRMFGQLIASNLQVDVLPPKFFDVPWTERVLSVLIKFNKKTIYFHTTHIPPGSSNGWIKIDMINGIVRHLIKHCDKTQILCGDFNTPQQETLENGLVTFGQKIDRNGIPKLKLKFRGGSGKDWDQSERSLFEELPKYDILESFRQIYPKTIDPHSWLFSRKGKVFGFRFDHFFASSSLNVCDIYYHPLKNPISDHLPLFVTFEI